MPCATDVAPASPPRGKRACTSSVAAGRAAQREAGHATGVPPERHRLQIRRGVRVWSVGFIIQRPQTHDAVVALAYLSAATYIVLTFVLFCGSGGLQKSMIDDGPRAIELEGGRAEATSPTPRA